MAPRCTIGATLVPLAIRTITLNMPDSLLARSGLNARPGACASVSHGRPLVSTPPSIPVGLKSGL